MIEIALVLLIVAQMVYHAWYVREAREEKAKLINAVLSKNAQELRDLEIAQNTEIKVEPIPPDFQPMENLSDEEHLRAIKQQLGTALGEEDGNR